MSNSYFWVKTSGDICTLGLTKQALEDLGNINYLDFPDIDQEINAGDELLSVEAEKAVSELDSPVSGTVYKINNDLIDNLDKLNNDPLSEKNYLLQLRQINN
ncbi:MAG: glycine cleavage system protein H [Firmicutes bacterium]|uniref:Glycine cleavage system protein H n=1 Tax=Candidatus Gallilactobacillus intestinavium TaxID=2840838 RepID=A0A9D9EA15_9LACO|nr:glycine cleavage system protein H [Candidatus Gallilactobacillus intestinavium]